MFRHTRIALPALLFLLFATAGHAQNDSSADKAPNLDEIITKQVDDLIDRYKLDDYQAFRVDTLLQHYIPIYNAAMKKVKDSGASQVDSYQMVLDYWGDFFDSEYQKIFSESQWKLYMQSAAGREKKKRDKRLEAARAGKQ